MALAFLLLATSAPAWASCPEAINQQEVQTTLDEVANAYASVEYEQAYSLLSQLEGRLGCQASVVPGALLHRFHQLKGAVALATGAEAYAGEQFEQAQVLAPPLGWDESLGTKGAALWESRKKALKRRPAASLRVTKLPRGVELALDGQRLKADSSRQVTGEHHLVQVSVNGGPWEQRQIVVPAGFAWQLDWQGEDLLVVPESTNPSTRLLVGSLVTATFGVSAALSAGIYIPVYLDCRDSCDDVVLERGFRARDVFIPSLTATVLSAGFTWLIPALLPDELTRAKALPKVGLSMTSDRESPLALGLTLSWRR